MIATNAFFVKIVKFSVIVVKVLNLFICIKIDMYIDIMP